MAGRSCCSQSLQTPCDPENSEDGDLGNVRQLLEAYAQSLVILALFHFFLLFLKQCIFDHALSQPPVVFLISTTQYIIFILPLKNTMEKILYPLLIK